MSELKIIAHIYNDFEEKFGIPRQSGLANVRSKIVFEPLYRNADAFRGLDGFSHIWILWQFSKAVRDEWSPTVRPPRLGGNTRMGVFATRSPFRPNPIGLSSVKLCGIELNTPEGPVLYVEGADLLSGTPIYDIKPYLAYTDSHPEASEGFALSQREGVLKVVVDKGVVLPEDKGEEIIELLAQDPRPQYQAQPERTYTMAYGGYDVSFRTDGEILTVVGIRGSRQ